MRTFIVLLFLSLLSVSSFSQEIEVVKFDSVKKMLKNDTDKILVINFWATWCKPCIKELPYFENINKKYENIEVVLINLDFVEQFSKVERFAAKKNLQSKVVLLDEIDYNSWIDQVSPKWSGAIPATYIIAPHAVDKKFVEGELSATELEEAVKLFL